MNVTVGKPNFKWLQIYTRGPIKIEVTERVQQNTVNIFVQFNLNVVLLLTPSNKDFLYHISY